MRKTVLEEATQRGRDLIDTLEDTTAQTSAVNTARQQNVLTATRQAVVTAAGRKRKANPASSPSEDALVKLTVRLPQSLVKSLKRYALERDTTVQEVVKEAVSKMVEANG